MPPWHGREPWLSIFLVLPSLLACKVKPRGEVDREAMELPRLIQPANRDEPSKRMEISTNEWAPARASGYPVLIDVSLLESEEPLSVQIGDHLPFTVERSRTPDDSLAQSYVGVSSSGQQVIIVRVREVVVGTVIDGARTFALRPDRNQMLALAGKYDAPDYCDRLSSETPAAYCEVTPVSDPIPRVGVVVMYTKRATTDPDKAYAMAALAIKEANVASMNSGAVVEFVLEQVEPEDRDEEDETIACTLNSFRERGSAGPKFDKVHGLRDKHNGDVAILLVNIPRDDRGKSHTNAKIDNAFAVVQFKAAASEKFHTFTHELGHLIGADHEASATTSTSLRHVDASCPRDGENYPGYEYAHAHRHLGSKTAGDPCWGTVMATSCTRKLYWSTPTVTYQDAALGSANENNAQALTKRAPCVAAFKHHE